MAQEGATLQVADNDLLKQVHDLTQQIQELQSRNSTVEMRPEDREQMQRLTDAVTKVNDQLSSRVQGRTSEFETAPSATKIANAKSAKEWLEKVHRSKPSGKDAEAIREFQDKADDLYLVSAITRKPVRELDMYRELNGLAIVQKANEAFDQANVGSAGDGWYPVQFSAQIHELVRLQRRVAALHPRINMPTDPYKLPIEGPDAQVFLVSENTLANDYVTADKLIAHADSLTAAALTNLSLSTSKIGARLTVSAEADEASITAMLPYFRSKLVRGMGDAEEDTTLNGDLLVGTSSAIDEDMQQTADLVHPRKAWKGYRKLANSGVKKAILSGGAGPGAGLTVDIADLRGLRVEFGRYGVTPSDLTLVTGPVGLNKLLSLRDGSNPSPVMTLEKYGPQATILTGEIARIDGTPLIISEHVRENLNHLGVYDGVTTDRTLIHMVNRAAFVYGDFRRLTLNSRYVPDTDQNVIVILQRLTFGSWFPADNTVGHLYGIRK